MARPLATVFDRDVAIMRFTYTFEAAWKALKAFLVARHQIDAGSPSACVRALRRIALLSDEQAEAGLRMITDRNLVVHTYNEALAEELKARLPDHLATLEAWVKLIRSEPDAV